MTTKGKKWGRTGRTGKLAKDGREHWLRFLSKVGRDYCGQNANGYSGCFSRTASGQGAKPPARKDPPSRTPRFVVSSALALKLSIPTGEELSQPVVHRAESSRFHPPSTAHPPSGTYHPLQLVCIRSQGNGVRCHRLGPDRRHSRRFGSSIFSSPSHQPRA